jgi:hypothetical protein
MTTAAPSTALATIQPAFTDPERLALAGFLAGYRGLTREAYALDLRQMESLCAVTSLDLLLYSAAGKDHGATWEGLACRDDSPGPMAALVTTADGLCGSVALATRYGPGLQVRATARR